MAYDNIVLEKSKKALFESRSRILKTNGFFGILLMSAGYRLDNSMDTAYTDGQNIAFNVDFLLSLKPELVDFVIVHELMHIILGHCKRGVTLDNHLFNEACDIVVNSYIMLAFNNGKPYYIKGKEMMHLAPNNTEGHLYSAEEVYAMLLKNKKKKGMPGDDTKEPDDSTFDHHDKWAATVDIINEWKWRVHDAYNTTISLPNKSAGTMPLGVDRIINELKPPQIDWKEILFDFIQEEVNDYTFIPADKRYDSYDFFLPDFNEKDLPIIQLYFLIDTSGSISDIQLELAYSEIQGCLIQYNNKIKGNIIFFDSVAYPMVSFETTDDLLKIKPVGGGGTDFTAPLIKVNDEISKNENIDINSKTKVIYITDGYAGWPDIKLVSNIDLLWIINNEESTPPFGKIARISEK
jgi:predicted metal-dependent peptidase